MNGEKWHHWRKVSKEPMVQYPTLQGDTECAVAVVGGGLTGLSAALQLAADGIDVCVLEMDRVGLAASGRNNGQVIPHHSKKSPSEIETLLGRARGERYNAIVADAPNVLFDLIARHDIACDAVTNGWIQACHSHAALARARQFQKEWASFGAPTQWLDRDVLARKVGSQSFLGGWKAARAGHLNPFALTQGLGRAAASAGARIYEQSPVSNIRRDGDRWLLDTPNGKVRAQQVLVVTNALTGSFWPHLRRALIPVRVFQVATRPLTPEQRSLILPNNEGVSDTRRDILAFRYDADWRLEAVGAHTLWHDAERRGLAAVIAKLRRAFPQLGDLQADEYWEGKLAAVPDRMPRLMQLAPGLLFAGVYSGRGVAMSTAWGREAARFMSGAITESELPIPLTQLRAVPAHGIAVQVANYLHPVHRLQDRLDSWGITGR
jgi:glycine/D-amino acid oxidase-like deaminating enzyme